MSRQPLAVDPKVAAQARQRIRNRNRRAARRLALLSSTLILLTVTAITLVASPLLQVRDIRISGSDSLTSQERYELQRVLKLPKGLPIARAPIGTLTETLTDLPYIRTAKIDRQLPCTLRVAISPRIPVLEVNTLEGERWEVDQELVPIRAASGQPWLPVIEMKQSIQISPGKPVGSIDLVLSVDAVTTLAKSSPISPHRITIDQLGCIAFEMPDDLVIELGRPDDLPKKLEALSSIYAADPRVATRMSRINLMNIAAPACVPRTSKPSGE